MQDLGLVNGREESLGDERSITQSQVLAAKSRDSSYKSRRRSRCSTRRMLSDLVNSSHVNATSGFPWSSTMEDMRGNARNEGAIAKANRQTTPSEWQAFSERNVQEAAEQVRSIPLIHGQSVLKG